MKNKKTAVVIESPYKGDIKLNIRYLEACIRDSVYRGETPYASHKMLTVALNDADPEERELGIQCGLEMSSRLDKHVFYTDLGWTEGMRKAYDFCVRSNKAYEVRQIGRDAFNELVRQLKIEHDVNNQFW